MKVIFTKDVPRVARAGEVKEVAAGYARNYLFVHKFASHASEQVVSFLEQKKVHRQERLEKKMKHIRDVFKKIEFMKIKVRAKSNKEGKLFAAIHARDICNELMVNKKIQLDPQYLFIEKPMKHVGEYKVSVRTPEETFGNITIEVVGETS